MCEQTGLLAGFAKIDITPDYQVGLGGYSNAESRRNTAILDRIYATCIALTDGDETILLYTLDNCSCGRGSADAIRKVVSEATGIPGRRCSSVPPIPTMHPVWAVTRRQKCTSSRYTLPAPVARSWRWLTGHLPS